MNKIQRFDNGFILLKVGYLPTEEQRAVIREYRLHWSIPLRCWFGYAKDTSDLEKLA